jgi:phosphoribosylformylglycinamidine synthase PurS subunit
MKQYLAKITITLRNGILDVQGKTIENALHSMDMINLSNLRIGKYVEMTVEAQNDGQALAFAEDACKKLIANPIIEDYFIQIVDPIGE